MTTLNLDEQEQNSAHVDEGLSKELINSLLPLDDDNQLKDVYKTAYRYTFNQTEKPDMSEVTEAVVLIIKSLESYRQQHGSSAGFGEPRSQITPDIMDKWCKFALDIDE